MVMMIMTTTVINSSIIIVVTEIGTRANIILVGHRRTPSFLGTLHMEPPLTQRCSRNSRVVCLGLKGFRLRVFGFRGFGFRV